MSENQLELATKQEARLHIDRTPHKSPNPTDGEALYALGKVKPGYALYQEVEGNEEDRLIPNGKEQVRLEEDEHFHSAEPHKKVFTIIVNGRPKEVDHQGRFLRRDRGPVRHPGRREHDLHRHLQEGPPQRRRHPGRGRHRQGQGWDDLQCHTNE